MNRTLASGLGGIRREVKEAGQKLKTLGEGNEDLGRKKHVRHISGLEPTALTC